MKITKHIINDLLPLYFAGEVSDETRQLVEEFFETDPEYAKWVRDQKDEILKMDLPATLDKEIEMKSLEKTKRMIKGKSMFMASAIFFTALSCSFGGDSEGIQWILWRDNPAAAGIMVVIGLFFWVQYFRLNNKLKLIGIQ